MAKIVSQFKECSKCKEIKSISEFKTMQKRGRTEIRSACILCSRIESKKYDDGRRAYIKKKNYRYYENNKEKENARSLVYIKSHPEKNRERARLFRKNNPGKVKFWDKRSYENNKERAFLESHNRRARIKGVGGKISKQEWRELCEKYGNRCINPDCRDPSRPITLDHVIPIKLGGKNVIENAQPLCKSCNSTKNIKIIDYRRLYD